MALLRVLILVLASMLVSLLVFMTTNLENETSGTHFNAQALLGKKVWQDNQCGTCHAIYGLGGHFGPDLTNVLARRDEHYIRWILPSGKNKMPVFDFNENETTSLLAYFEVLQQSGVYPLPTLWKNAYGQVHNPNDKKQSLNED